MQRIWSGEEENTICSSLAWALFCFRFGPHLELVRKKFCVYTHLESVKNEINGKKDEKKTRANGQIFFETAKQIEKSL